MPSARSNAIAALSWSASALADGSGPTLRGSKSRPGAACGPCPMPPFVVSGNVTPPRAALTSRAAAWRWGSRCSVRHRDYVSHRRRGIVAEPIDDVGQHLGVHSRGQPAATARTRARAPSPHSERESRRPQRRWRVSSSSFWSSHLSAYCHWLGRMPPVISNPGAPAAGSGRQPVRPAASRIPRCLFASISRAVIASISGVSWVVSGVCGITSATMNAREVRPRANCTAAVAARQRACRCRPSVPAMPW